MVRHDTIKLLIAISTRKDWRIFHLDVKSAFLNGILKENIYISQPEGYEVQGFEHKVCKLVKALYGLKKLVKLGMKKNEYFRNQGFNRSFTKPTLYV